LTVADSSYDCGKRRTGATKLRIMADAFLSSNVATDYIEKLQHDELIEYNVDTNSYKTTVKGKQLLCLDPK